MTIALAASSVSAGTIGFEQYASGTDVTGVDLGGVTLSAGGSSLRVVESGTLVAEQGGDKLGLQVPFSATESIWGDLSVGASGVSANLGNLALGPSILFLAAYRAIQRKTGLDLLIGILRAWFRSFWMISMAFVGEVLMRFSNVLAALINLKTFLGAWSLRFV